MRLSDETLERFRWQERALCRRGVDLEEFFPEVKPRRDTKERCQRCPVQAECLRFALDFNMVGLWGGTSTKERAKLKIAG